MAMTFGRSGSERALWHTLRPRLLAIPRALVRRIENGAGEGDPDVYLCSPSTGPLWIELKYRRQWPQRLDRIVTLPHFTPAQRSWHLAHATASGRSWVLLQVARHYMLLPGAQAAVELGLTLTQQRLTSGLWVWAPRLPGAGELARALGGAFAPR